MIKAKKIMKFFNFGILLMQCIEPKSGKGESSVQNAMDFQPTLSLCCAHMCWKLYLIGSSKRPRTAVKKFERNIFIWFAALYVKYYKTDLLNGFVVSSGDWAKTRLFDCEPHTL